MPKLKIYDISDAQRDNTHGMVDKKIGWTLHETVSPQIPHSLNDIKSVSEFLDNEDYGIHGIADNDGFAAWAWGLGKARFYHTASTGRKGSGEANTNFMGIECISRVMLDYASNVARIRAWLHMNKEINTVAKMIACSARSQKLDISYIVDNKGDTTKKGVTTHWEVTMFYGVPGGHVDAHPVNRGGYFPKGLIITLARRYYRLGWTFKKP